MKRPAWRSLSSCLIAALAACTGSAATPPSHTRPASVAVTSAATGASSAQAPPAATPSVVAVVTGYYRVRYGPYHAHLRMARARHGWSITSMVRI
jgi:hypothetical protein